MSETRQIPMEKYTLSRRNLLIEVVKLGATFSFIATPLRNILAQVAPPPNPQPPLNPEFPSSGNVYTLKIEKTADPNVIQQLATELQADINNNSFVSFQGNAYTEIPQIALNQSRKLISDLGTFQFQASSFDVVHFVKFNPSNLEYEEEQAAIGILAFLKDDTTINNVDYRAGSWLDVDNEGSLHSGKARNNGSLKIIRADQLTADVFTQNGYPINAGDYTIVESVWVDPENNIVVDPETEGAQERIAQFFTTIEAISLTTRGVEPKDKESVNIRTYPAVNDSTLTGNTDKLERGMQLAIATTDERNIWINNLINSNGESNLTDEDRSIIDALMDNTNDNYPLIEINGYLWAPVVFDNTVHFVASQRLSDDTKYTHTVTMLQSLPTPEYAKLPGHEINTPREATLEEMRTFWETYQYQPTDIVELNQVSTNQLASNRDRFRLNIIRNGIEYNGLPINELGGGIPVGLIHESIEEHYDPGTIRLHSLWPLYLDRYIAEEKLNIRVALPFNGKTSVLIFQSNLEDDVNYSQGGGSYSVQKTSDILPTLNTIRLGSQIQLSSFYIADPEKFNNVNAEVLSDDRKRILESISSADSGAFVESIDNRQSIPDNLEITTMMIAFPLGSPFTPNV